MDKVKLTSARRKGSGDLPRTFTVVLSSGEGNPGSFYSFESRELRGHYLIGSSVKRANSKFDWHVFDIAHSVEEAESILYEAARHFGNRLCEGPYVLGDLEDLTGYRPQPLSREANK